MDRDFLEKRKKDLNAYLQVSLCLFLPIDFHFNIANELSMSKRVSLKELS